MKSGFKYTILLSLILAATLIPVALKANEGNSEDSLAITESKPLFDFFNSDELLEISLQFNIREFIRTRNEPVKKFNARLTVNEGNKMLSQDIKLNVRGKMRRKYCSFPPIMLKVKNSKTTDQVFPKGNYKLVTHCSVAGNFENYILKEYLAYRLYNILTPYSFKTRLVMVNYIDSLNPKRVIKEYGILIEDLDDLAERNNTIIVENLRVSQNHMDEFQMARVALFNYMIGNTDWSVAEQHNIKVLKTNQPMINKGIPVSYDFDYSGFVNTSYAIPNEKIPINSVTERYFLGGCYSDDLFKQVFSEFESIQPEIVQTIENFHYLRKTQKKQVLAYINNFYKKYRKEELLIADLNKTCHRLN